MNTGPISCTQPYISYCFHALHTSKMKHHGQDKGGRGGRERGGVREEEGGEREGGKEGEGGRE